MSSYSNQDAYTILLSALSIELCRYAIGKPLPLAYKITRLVRVITAYTGAGSITTVATNSSNRAYSLVNKELNKQVSAEVEQQERAKHRQAQLEKAQALRVAKFEKEQQLRVRRAKQA